MEISEKLEVPLSDYNAYLDRQRIKYQTGIVKTIIVTSLEIAAVLAHFKWASAAKALFVLRRGQEALLEAETKAPGREVAYTDAGRTSFGRG